MSVRTISPAQNQSDCGFYHPWALSMRFKGQSLKLFFPLELHLSGPQCVLRVSLCVCECVVVVFLSSFNIFYDIQRTQTWWFGVFFPLQCTCQVYTQVSTLWISSSLKYFCRVQESQSWTESEVLGSRDSSTHRVSQLSPDSSNECSQLLSFPRFKLYDLWHLTADFTTWPQTVIHTELSEPAAT